MRSILALVLVLSLALQAFGQVVPSSISAAAPSTSVSTTGTYFQPLAPVNLKNLCLNHIINICPGWEDPAGDVLGRYRLYVAAQGSSAIQTFEIASPSTRVSGLAPATLYDVWVQGQAGNGVWSANTSFVTMQTNSSDPKYDPTRDIQAFTCTRGVNPANDRVAATCTWTAAQDAVRQINFKVQCTSSTREPTLVRRRVYGATAAAATSAFFAISRDAGTCTFKARFYYARRPTTRHSFTLAL